MKPLFIIILLSLVPHKKEANVFFEPFIKDSMRVTLFADCFYSYPPGLGHNSIHSIDTDSIRFVTRDNTITFTHSSLTTSFYTYLWMKYTTPLLDSIRCLAAVYPYREQRVKWTGRILLVPDSIPPGIKAGLSKISKRLTSNKWCNKWNLHSRSPKRLEKTRTWVLNHIDSRLLFSDSLFIIQIVDSNSTEESIYVCNSFCNNIEGWHFTKGRKVDCPEPRGIDTTVYSSMIKLINQVSLKPCIETFKFNSDDYRMPLSDSRHYYILLLTRNLDDYTPVYYYSCFPECNDNKLWLL